MKIKMHLPGISIALLLSVYAVTVYAGQNANVRKEAEQSIIKPEIRYPEADGSQGYYKTHPDIYIFHRQAGAVTKYEFLSADNTKKTGSLELMEGQTEESVYLGEENFKEGENILHVWMEKEPLKPEENGNDGSGENGTIENESEKNDEPEEKGLEENESEENISENNESGNSDAGDDEPGTVETENDDTGKSLSTDDAADTEDKDHEVNEDLSSDEKVPSGEPEIVFEKEIHFLLDTKKPLRVHFSYDKAVRDDSIFTNEPVTLTMKSEDEGSGTEAVYYTTGTGITGVLEGGSGSITLNPGFQGAVEAYAVDKAGNRSETAVSEKILCENTPPEIWIETENEIDIWYSKPVKIDVSVSDHSLSAGLRSMKCYAGGSVIVNKENEFNTEVTSMETSFTIDVASEGGKGIPVVVEAQDWAGNYHSESRLIYIDNTAPAIRSEGVHDDMIAGTPVKGKMVIQEENDLALAKMEVWKIGSNKKKELLEEKKKEPEPFSGPQELAWDIGFEEDGIYEIILTAKDRAGHEISQSSHVTLDQTNPVIRYVDQMQGVYVPYFQWNYGKEEVVQDETEYSYDIFLDGTRYETGKRIVKEGVKMLQVRAVDAAGNESTAEAVFQIDHTPPKIRVYDVEDGNSYKDAATVSISVDGKGEYLKEISINSEKMKLESNCQIFSQSFQEAGDYQIQVLAEDLAGNQERELLTFRIEEQKQLAGGIWKPITRIFRNVKETPGQTAKQEVVKQETSPAVWWLILCFVLVILASVLKWKIGFSRKK